MVNHLMQMGMVLLARDHTKRGIPLAGRLRHYLPNWRVVTQDQWVLEAVKGYRIPFTQEPQQTCPPRQITLSQEGNSLMVDEIQGMLEKGVISPPPPTGHSLVMPTLWYQFTRRTGIYLREHD